MNLQLTKSNRSIGGALALIWFLLPIAASAQLCFNVKTKSGVTPVKESYELFAAESSCYTSNGCNASLGINDMACKIICTRDPDTIDSSGNITNRCKTLAGGAAAKELKDPWYCAYRLTGGTIKGECTKDPNYCANNVTSGITDCTCAENLEKCPATGSAPAAGVSTKIPELKNPLGTTDVREIVANAIKIFTGISGSLALLMFVYGGFLWVTSAGNMEKVKHGQKAVVNAALGLVIIFTAYAVISTVFKILSGVAL